MTRKRLPKGVKKRWWEVWCRAPTESQYRRVDRRRRTQANAEALASELREKLKYEAYVSEVWRLQ